MGSTDLQDGNPANGSKAQPTLDSPLRIGTIELKHRIVMAPLTRLRSSSLHVPLDIAKTYYTQRASLPGTLLITEATFIGTDSRGRGANAPGIFNAEQTAQWKTIVDAVHAQGSFIFCQLWHVGRAARATELERLGLECVSSSAVKMPPAGRLVSNVKGGVPDDYETPRAMTEEEIQQTIENFAAAAKNAVHGAGFDGVEIHGANGYLVDQFTQSNCNRRTDSWGGTIENRSRFCLAVARAVADAVGAERTAMRLSPFSTFQGMRMEDPVPQFTHLIERLSEMKLAYLHLIEPRVAGNVDRDVTEQENLDFAFKAWKRAAPVILAGGFTPESAKRTVEKTHAGEDVAIAFGRHFISNPDLPRRILHGIKLSHYNRETFYTPESAEGYIDYEFSPL